MAALAVAPGQELQIQHNETYYMIRMCRKMIICHCNMHVTHINTKAYMITRIYSRHSIIIQYFFIYLIDYMHHSGRLRASLTAIASSGRRHYSMSGNIWSQWWSWKVYLLIHLLMHLIHLIHRCVDTSADACVGNSL